MSVHVYVCMYVCVAKRRNSHINAWLTVPVHGPFTESARLPDKMRTFSARELTGCSSARGQALVEFFGREAPPDPIRPNDMPVSAAATRAAAVPGRLAAMIHLSKCRIAALPIPSTFPAQLVQYVCVSNTVLASF